MKKNLKPTPDLTINTKQVNVICLGNSEGSATVIPTGGTPPYSYLWGTVPNQTTAIASNLKAGPYTVTVMDKNGNTAKASVIITKESNICKRFYPDKIILETYTDINEPPTKKELPVNKDDRYIFYFLSLNNYLTTDEQRKYEIIIPENPDFIEIEGKYFYVPEGREERLTQTEIDIYLVKKILSENIQIIPKLLDYQLLKYPDKINRLYELEAVFHNKTRFYISQYEHKKDHQEICKKWVKRQLKRYSEHDNKFKVENKGEKGISLRPEIKPIFNHEAIETIFDLLKDFFSKEHQTELKRILQTGNDASTHLIFLDNGNRLADALKQLYKADYITGCQQNELEAWIQRNYCFRNRGEIKEYTLRYLNDIISTNKPPCKKPILKVAEDKTPGKNLIVKA
jgi:hypothetical protein